MAVDARDDRLRAGRDLVEALLELEGHLRDPLFRVGRIAVEAPHRGQVGSDREVLLVLAGEDHDPYRRVGAELPERGRELLHQVRGDAVVALPVHDHGGDSTVTLDVDAVAHQAVNRGMPPAISSVMPVM